MNWNGNHKFSNEKYSLEKEFFTKIKELKMNTEIYKYSDPNGYIVFEITGNNSYNSYRFQTYTEMINSFNGNVIWSHERGVYIVRPEFISERDYHLYGQEDGFEAFNAAENNIYWFSTYEEMMDTLDGRITWNHENDCYNYYDEENCVIEMELHHTTNEL